MHFEPAGIPLVFWIELQDFNGVMTREIRFCRDSVCCLPGQNNFDGNIYRNLDIDSLQQAENEGLAVCRGINSFIFETCNVSKAIFHEHCRPGRSCRPRFHAGCCVPLHTLLCACCAKRVAYSGRNLRYRNWCYKCNSGIRRPIR